MTTQTKKKATRKLSNLDFSKEGAAVALVGDIVGGAANGHTTLIMKSRKKKLSQEEIFKAQQVRITMELPEFLEKFFYLWDEDADLLAAMMGYDFSMATPELESPLDSEGGDGGAEAPEGMDDVQESAASAMDLQAKYQQYITDKVASFEILKSLKESDDISLALAELPEDKWNTLIAEQEVLEKSVSQAYLKKSTKGASASEEDSSTTVEKQVEPSGSEVTTEGKQMPIETVEKSALIAVQKALDEKTELLQKALEKVEAFEQAQKEAVTKARFDKVEDALKDKAKAEILFKGLNLIEKEDDFDATIDVLKSISALIEESALFVEHGETIDEGQSATKESNVAKALKAKLKVA